MMRNKGKVIFSVLILAALLSSCKGYEKQNEPLEPITASVQSSSSAVTESVEEEMNLYDEDGNLLFVPEGSDHPLTGEFLDKSGLFTRDEEESYSGHTKSFLADFAPALFAEQAEEQTLQESLRPFFYQDENMGRWTLDEFATFVSEHGLQGSSSDILIRELHSVNNLDTEKGDMAIIGCAGFFEGRFLCDGKSYNGAFFSAEVILTENKDWKLLSFDLIGLVADVDSAYLYYEEGSQNTRITCAAKDMCILAITDNPALHEDVEIEDASEEESP